jgi:deoxycytidylate deaminase
MDNSKHIIFLKMAKELKSFSKCEKVHVGCIIVNNNRIITTGVNGSASGHENCCDKFHNIYNNLSAFSHIPYYQTYSEYKQSDVFLKEHSI